jgi:hypothetical protein
MKLRLLILSAATAAALSAQNVRVTTQVIEVPHRTLTAWTAGEPKSGPELHRLAWELVKKDEARVVDTSILSGKAGEKMAIESITECIFPTEVDASSPLPLPSESSGGIAFFPPVFRYTPTAFETRNAGITLEAMSSGSGDAGVGLQLVSSLVGRAPATEWKTFRDAWGDASIRCPTFRTHRQIVQTDLVPGQYEWIGLMNPEPQAAPALEKRRMVFVRVEVLKLEGAE